MIWLPGPGMRYGLTPLCSFFFFFFFNDTATTEIYTLSLHDALPILRGFIATSTRRHTDRRRTKPRIDRKSTRLNSSHELISYAVFCLKKKKSQRSPAGHDATLGDGQKTSSHHSGNIPSRVGEESAVPPACPSSFF